MDDYTEQTSMGKKAQETPTYYWTISYGEIQRRVAVANVFFSCVQNGDPTESNGYRKPLIMAMALGKPNRLHKWLKVMNLEKGQEERVDWYVGD